jgi:DNA-binding CsgD family transcriptional regulator
MGGRSVASLGQYAGMSKAPLKDQLLLALLEGSFESPPWTRFLDALRRQSGANYSSLIFRPPGMAANKVFHLYAGKRSPPHVQQVYEERFYKLDPLPYHAMREGEVYDLDALLPADDPARKAYEREIMAPSGMNALRTMRVAEPSGVSAWLTITRRVGDFPAASGTLLRWLAPYLRRVLRSFVALERERTNALLSGEAIHRLDYGWIALDGSARVLETDPHGRMMLERSDFLRRDPEGRLSAPSAKQSRDILSTVRALTKDDNARPRAMVLCRDPWLDMLLVPANRGSRSAKSMPAVIAYVHGESAPSADRCEQLMQLFELLPSEARLALALSRGMSIVEAARELGLTVETTRTYSKNIYAKMGARGQTDLVRFIHRSVLRIA